MEYSLRCAVSPRGSSQLASILSMGELWEKIVEFASRRVASRLDVARTCLRIMCGRPISWWGCAYEIQKAAHITRLLFVSIRCENIGAVRALLRVRGGVPRGVPRGVAPLYVASYVGSLEIVHMLLSRGACPNVRTALHSVTALMIAAQQGHLSVMLRLLWAGADPTKVDSSGRTACDIYDR